MKLKKEVLFVYETFGLRMRIVGLRSPKPSSEPHRLIIFINDHGEVNEDVLEFRNWRTLKKTARVEAEELTGIKTLGRYIDPEFEQTELWWG